MTNDGVHSYTYDAEGNIVTVDNGSTATYVYDALNHRVRTVVGSAQTEFVFKGVPGDRSSSLGLNANGQRVSEWNAAVSYQLLKTHYYWGGKPVAFYTFDSNRVATVHYQHQDWLGTERTRTSSNGAVEGTYTSLPWGDGQSSTGSDQDANHFATLDHDAESNTDHAEFRQYSNTQGRFMSPDPYDGSYDPSNPQSMNRYTYALNNPLSNIDPSGLSCQDTFESGETNCPGVSYAFFFGSGARGGGGCTIDGGMVPCQMIINSIEGAGGSENMGYYRHVSNWKNVLVIPDPRFPGDPATYFKWEDFGYSVWVPLMGPTPNQLGTPPSGNTGGSSSGVAGGAPNNGTSVLDPKPTVKQKFFKWVCKNSSQNRIIASMEWGAATGMLKGGFAGATGGAAFEGVGAVPGALLGGFAGGVFGAAGGVLTGGATAGACSLGGAY
jgi:RHS repeat-associated protein